MIAGKPQPYDFEARDGDQPVGRIFKHRAGPLEGKWRWSMIAIGRHLRRPPDCHGNASTKAEAVVLVTECYTVALGRAKGER